MYGKAFFLSFCLLGVTSLAVADSGPHWTLEVHWLDDTSQTYENPNDGWIYLPASATRRGWNCSLLQSVSPDHYEGLIHCTAPGSEQKVSIRCADKKRHDSIQLTLYEPDGQTWLAKMHLSCRLK